MDKLPRTKRKRLSSEDRRAQIVRAAIDLFAREGFQGSTRDLARKIGVTQPLIYRYFPNKQELIREVYNEVFVRKWKPQWEATIRDRRRPLAERLKTFYLEYTSVVFSPEWMRIYIYSGLIGLELNRWWSEFIEERLLMIICDELRNHYSLEPIGDVSATPAEMEMLWNFQGGIFYYGMRRDIYKCAVHTDFERYLEITIKVLIASSASLLTGAPEQLDPRLSSDPTA